MAGRRFGRGAVAIASSAAAIVVGAAVGVAPPAGGQAAPTLTVDPTRTGPNQPITVTVAGCDVPPEGQRVAYSYRFDDVLWDVVLTEAAPGTWTGTVSSGGADVWFRTVCDGVELEAEVDTDRPVLLPQPWAPPGSFPDPPQSYLGTDCPDGTTARAFFQAEGRPAPIAVTAEIDERGDWTAAVPAFPDGLEVWVDASCGDVTYPETSYISGGSDTTSTTTATSTSTAPPTAAPLPLPQAPAPASPVPGSPSLTG